MAVALEFHRDNAIVVNVNELDVATISLKRRTDELESLENLVLIYSHWSTFLYTAETAGLPSDKITTLWQGYLTRPREYHGR